MKTTPIAAAVASLFLASMGTVAFAQQTTPQQTPPPMSSSAMSNNSTNGMHHMSDAKTAKMVKQALKAHGVKVTNLNVTCDNGSVAITGAVANQNDVNKAKLAAMNVRGVKHVFVSGLHVKGPGFL